VRWVCCWPDVISIMRRTKSAQTAGRRFSLLIEPAYDDQWVTGDCKTANSVPYWHELNTTLNCAEHNPDAYRDNKLVWFRRESKSFYNLSVSRSDDGKTFTLTASAISLVPYSPTKDEGQIETISMPIDQTTLGKMHKPRSRFLTPYDFVIFEDSPQSEARYGS
jgi:hypothetical protein